MDEKALKKSFIDNGIELFGNIIGRKNIRLYAIEFPTKSGEQTFFADIVLEDDVNKHAQKNDMFILEFKDDIILHSALDQLNLYCDAIPKQLYRSGLVIGILVSSKGFSDWELKEAKKQGRLCALYDGQNLLII